MNTIAINAKLDSIVKLNQQRASETLAALERMEQLLTAIAAATGALNVVSPDTVTPAQPEKVKPNVKGGEGTSTEPGPTSSPAADSKSS